MSETARLKSFIVTAAYVLLLSSLGLADESRHCLTHHLRAAVRNHRAKRMGKYPAGQVMTLNVVLPLRDPTGLDSFLKAVYDPASPSYRHFLTVAEFTERFGPTQQDYNAVVKFVRANKFAVIGGTRDGMNLVIKGPVMNVEKAFHVKMSPIGVSTRTVPFTRQTANLPWLCRFRSGTSPAWTTIRYRSPGCSRKAPTQKLMV